MYDDYVQRLSSMGFTLHTPSNLIESNVTKVDVTNHECGHMFNAKLLNILHGKSKCGVCGPIKRAANATIGYLKKFGRDYDLKEFEDYKTRVQQESNKTYRKHINTINPHRHPRARSDQNPDAWHLDHKMPIIECFRRDWSIEQAAALENLQMLTAKENLSKKQKIQDVAFDVAKLNPSVLIAWDD